MKKRTSVIIIVLIIATLGTNKKTTPPQRRIETLKNLAPNKELSITTSDKGIIKNRNAYNEKIRLLLHDRNIN